MKKILLISVVFVVLLCSISTASPTDDYVKYNLKISQIIFKELTLMENANEIFNSWTNCATSKDEAIKQMNIIKSLMETNTRELKRIDASKLPEKLHTTYTVTNDTLVSSVKNNIQFVQTNEPTAEGMRDKLSQHLINYVNCVYECQVKNIQAQIDFQLSIGLASETENIKEYYQWNNEILKILLKQVLLSKDMEKMMIYLSTGFISLEEAQKEEKNIKERALQIKKEISEIKLSNKSKVSDLQELFAKSFDNYVFFINNLEDFLIKPSKEKSKKMHDSSKSANKSSFEFNEACFRYLEKSIKGEKS